MRRLQPDLVQGDVDGVLVVVDDQQDSDVDAQGKAKQAQNT